MSVQFSSLGCMVGLPIAPCVVSIHEKIFIILTPLYIFIMGYGILELLLQTLANSEMHIFICTCVITLQYSLGRNHCILSVLLCLGYIPTSLPWLLLTMGAWIRRVKPNGVVSAGLSRFRIFHIPKIHPGIYSF